MDVVLVPKQDTKTRQRWPWQMRCEDCAQHRTPYEIRWFTWPDGEGKCSFCFRTFQIARSLWRDGSIIEIEMQRFQKAKLQPRFPFRPR